MLEAGVWVPTNSLYRSLVRPGEKTDGSWRLTVDYRDLNQVVPPIGSAVPDTQKMQGGCYSVSDLVNAFFPVLISEKSQQQLAFTWEGSQFTFLALQQRYLNPLAYCCDLVRRDVDLMRVASVIVHYTDGVTVIAETKEQARTDVSATGTHMTNWGGLVNPALVPRPARTVKFLGRTWAGATWDIPQETKNKPLSLSSPGPNKKPSVWLADLDFHLGMLLPPGRLPERKL